MKKLPIFLTIILLSISLMAQDQNESSNFQLVFYNVENLFDTEDSPKTNDSEFLPDGSKEWTQERYQKKLDDLAKVLLSIEHEEYPDLIGMCEVENRKVLEDLIDNTALKARKYEIVHEESPDFRGIDVALIYNPKEFTYVAHEAIKVKLKGDPGYKTRDILYVQGKSIDGTLMHVFVNHWKSRRGGVGATEAKRVNAASIVRERVDKILSKDPVARIVIVGDFNDNPTNKSISETLKAGSNKESSDPTELYNLLRESYVKDSIGSYSYRGKWDMLDQIIVSRSFFGTDGLVADYAGANVHKPDWILHHSKKYGTTSPNRTYGGNNYYGGYSDHLPVYLNMKLEPAK